MVHYDAVIVGSGPGGAMAADGLVRSGARVLMLERGDWVVRGPQNHLPDAIGMLSPHYSMLTPSDVESDAGRHPAGAFHCVGGQSVFYAAVALRYREQDFVRTTVGVDDGVWPFGYDELEPHYARAERLLGVSGDTKDDPTEPFRSAPLAEGAPALSPAGTRLHAAARRLGLHPFQPPVAITREEGSRPACVRCGACDGFACGVDAKGDASQVVSALMRLGLELRSRSPVVRILSAGTRATGVEYFDVRAQRYRVACADAVILGAGALATPHLLLASGLPGYNPGGRVVGRYLTRHCNAVVCGAFRGATGRGPMSYKELAIQDFYLGHSGYPTLGGLGSIQQEAVPAALVERMLPRLLRPLGRAVVPHLAALIVMTEDEPVSTNRVTIDRRRVNAFNMPALRVHHHYTPRDLARRHALIGEARKLLAEAGAFATIWRAIDTFAHALGTVRMGNDPVTSALDADGRFRGFDNLYVTDGSALPTSAAVNPSLTIAANALRIADRIVSGSDRPAGRVRVERREAADAIA